MMKDNMMLKGLEKDLEKIGIKKNDLDDYMVWGVYKLALGVMKTKWSLEESGAKDADKKLDQIIDLIKNKPADELHELLHKSGKGDWK